MVVNPHFCETMHIGIPADPGITWDLYCKIMITGVSRFANNVLFGGGVRALGLGLKNKERTKGYQRHYLAFDDNPEHLL